jgi:hypothetical protein
MPAVSRARTRGERQRGQAAAHELAAVLRRVRPPQERARLRRAGAPAVSHAPGEQGYGKAGRAEHSAPHPEEQALEQLEREARYRLRVWRRHDAEPQGLALAG